MPALNNEKALVRLRKGMKLSSDYSGGRDHISLYSLFGFPLATPGACQLSQTSSDAILAPTTGVLARKFG